MIVWISSSCCRSEISWGGGFSRCVRHQNHPKSSKNCVPWMELSGESKSPSCPSISSTSAFYICNWSRVSTCISITNLVSIKGIGIPAKATRNTRPCPWKNTPSWCLPAQLYPSPLRSNEPSCHLGSWHAGLPVFKKNKKKKTCLRGVGGGTFIGTCKYTYRNIIP